MPVRSLSGTYLSYALVVFDETGNERTEPDGTLLSEKLAERVADPARPVSDVFLTAHGWKGDLPAAIEQFDRWIGAVAAQSADIAAAQGRRLAPLIVGLHWPSLPFGDEKLPRRCSRARGGDDEAGRLGAPHRRHAACARSVRAILRAARGETNAGTPSPRCSGLWRAFAESGLEARGSLRRWFDQRLRPNAIIAQSQATGGAPAARCRHAAPERPFPLAASASLLEDEGPRAHSERTARGCSACRSSRRARASLMGHSFGCIVVSATVAGRRTRPAATGRLALPRPGCAALSCGRHPFAKEPPTTSPAS